MEFIQLEYSNFDKWKFDNTKTISKKSNEIITIGREPGNDIMPPYPFIPRRHGRIYLEKGVFTTHLD